MSRERNGASGGAKGTPRATVAAPLGVLGGKGRWSARCKMTVVLELLRGAELEATNWKYGVTAATLTHWREAFQEGGRPSDPGQEGQTEGAAEPCHNGEGSGSDGTAVERSHDAAPAGAEWVDNFRLRGSRRWRRINAPLKKTWWRT